MPVGALCVTQVHQHLLIHRRGVGGCSMRSSIQKESGRMGGRDVIKRAALHVCCARLAEVADGPFLRAIYRSRERSPSLPAFPLRRARARKPRARRVSRETGARYADGGPSRETADSCLRSPCLYRTVNYAVPPYRGTLPSACSFMHRVTLDTFYWSDVTFFFSQIYKFIRYTHVSNCLQYVWTTNSRRDTPRCC